MMRLFACLILGMISQVTWAQQPPVESSKSLPKEEVLKLVKQALAEKKHLSATKDAEYFYEYQTDDKPCPHCPQYLNLVRQVNQIVERLPAHERESVALQNESLIQLNRLKFMYYEVKVSEENGGEKCYQYQHVDPFRKKLVTDKNSIVLAEKMLALPHVTSLQYMFGTDEKEIRYFYKGEGAQSGIIIEVVIYPDRTAVVRYRKSTENEYNLPDLGSDTSKRDLRIPEAVMNIGTALSGGDKEEIKKTVLSQEIEIAEKKGKVSLGEGLNISSDTKAKVNQQSLAVALKNEAGKDWVKVDVNHKTLKTVDVSTVVPVEVKLDEGGLALGGAIKFESHKDYDGEATQTKTVVLGLTDHNHEYLRTTLVKREEVDEVILSSRYSIGKMGNVSGTMLTDSTGRKEYSIAHGISDTNSSMTTRYGMSSDAKKFFELQREQKIGKNQSMVLTLRTDDNRETTIMYQYRLTLK